SRWSKVQLTQKTDRHFCVDPSSVFSFWMVSKHISSRPSWHSRSCHPSRAEKREMHTNRGLPIDDNFYIWDYRYYDRLYVARNLDFDDFLVKKYFPVSVVIPAILDIYQNLLGVKFVEITGDARDAQQFAVWEMDAKDESGFIGYCYLDLFPRGKAL
ncbi:peptidase family M3-domain-containing protein, partial [Boletus edulis BED1]